MTIAHIQKLLILLLSCWVADSATVYCSECYDGELSWLEMIHGGGSVIDNMFFFNNEGSMIICSDFASEYAGKNVEQFECIYYQGLVYEYCGCPIRPAPLCNFCPDGQEVALDQSIDDPNYEGLTCGGAEFFAYGAGTSCSEIEDYYSDSLLPLFQSSCCVPTPTAKPTAKPIAKPTAKPVSAPTPVKTSSSPDIMVFNWMFGFMVTLTTVSFFWM
jgi:hypothetical protein